MHKRKQYGIIKYGNRKHGTTPKLQEGGGFAAYAPLYEWKDDPYELALLRGKMYGDRYRRGRSTSTGTGKAVKTPKINLFSEIEGGLLGMNTVANNAFRKEQQAYFDNIDKYGASWAGSEDGQRMYQALVNRGKQLKNILTTTEENFKELQKDIATEDKDALAISADNGAFVLTKNGEFTRINFGDYLKAPESYTILKIKDLIDWRKKSSRFDDAIETEFLGNSAVEDKTFYERFIKPNEDKFQYKVLDNKGLVKVDAKGKESPIVNVTQFMQGLSNVMRGVPFYAGTEVPEYTSDQAVREAVKSVYNDALNFSDNRSILEASLRSEVLKNKYVIAELKKLKTPKERAEFIAVQEQMALVKKFFDKGVKRAYGGNDDAGEITNAGGYSPSSVPGNEKAKANSVGVIGSVIADMNNPVQKRYVVGDVNETDKETGEKRPRADVVELPMAPGVLTTAELSIPSEPDIPGADITQTKVRENDALSVLAEDDNSSIVTEDGRKVKDAINGSVKDWLESSVRLNPEAVDLVFLPTDKYGNVYLSKLGEVTKFKDKARKAFVNYRKKKGEPIKTPFNKLYPNNRNEGAQEDYLEFMTWLELGANIEGLQLRLEAAKKDGNKKEEEKIMKYLVDAKEAADTLREVREDINKAFGGKKIFLKPYLKASVVVNDDGDYHFKDGYDKNNKGSAFAGLVKKAESTERNYMENIAKVDQSRWSNFFKFNWFDEFYTANIFIPLKNPVEIAAKNKEKLDALSNIHNTWRAIESGYNNEYVLSNNNIKTTYEFLIN